MRNFSKNKSEQSSNNAAQPFFGKERSTEKGSFSSKGSTNQQAGSFFIQAKLTIGQPGDQYERQADAVADRIVGQLGENIQRQEVPEEEEIHTG